ncbi:MAG: response regulator transcription factor [Anaerolineales bacterium]|nr:response regulator transcription factor [Anaerolineales bacterium]
MRTVLAVTDQYNIIGTWQEELENAGFHIISVRDRQTALGVLKRDKPELVLFDLEFTEVDGSEICHSSEAPILALTSYVEKAEKAVIQEAWADDLLLKPFSSQQLKVRMQIMLRTANEVKPKDDDLIRIKDLTLNLARHQATVAGKPVNLTPTEGGLLAALGARPGLVFTRSQLIDELNARGKISERTIDSHIKNLRAKIETDPQRPRYVVTVHGVGYKLGA